MRPGFPREIDQRALDLIAKFSACFFFFSKIYSRFQRWAKTGVWQRVFQTLARNADNEEGDHHFDYRSATRVCPYYSYLWHDV